MKTKKLEEKIFDLWHKKNVLNRSLVYGWGFIIFGGVLLYLAFYTFHSMIITLILFIIGIIFIIKGIINDLYYMRLYHIIGTKKDTFNKVFPEHYKEFKKVLGLSVF